MVIFHGYEIDYIILYLLLPIKKMVIFHGYDKSPEGKCLTNLTKNCDLQVAWAQAFIFIEQTTGRI